jgi:hypothetical protein
LFPEPAANCASTTTGGYEDDRDEGRFLYTGSGVATSDRKNVTIYFFN